MNIVCSERTGDIERHVWPFTFTPDATKALYAEAAKFPILFGQKLASIDDFLGYFITQNLSGIAESKGMIWIIDDFKGMFYLEGITDAEATVHYSFFDRIHNGREPLVRAMIKEVFDKYGFRRLNAYIPAYVGSGPKFFVERCGFKREGRKRKSSWWQGKTFDTYMYGILPEDL